MSFEDSFLCGLLFESFNLVLLSNQINIFVSNDRGAFNEAEKAKKNE